MQSLSEVKMGRGSPICERVRKNIVEYVKLLCKSHHNIIKSFRETGEISVRKGQGRRPLLDARGLQASDDTASLIGMILSLTLLNGPRNTSRNHCR